MVPFHWECQVSIAGEFQKVASLTLSQMIRGTDRSQRNLEVMQMSSVSNCAALIGPIRVKQLAFMAEWTAVPRPLVDLT